MVHLASRVIDIEEFASGIQLRVMNVFWGYRYVMILSVLGVCEFFQSSSKLSIKHSLSSTFLNTLKSTKSRFV